MKFPYFLILAGICSVHAEESMKWSTNPVPEPIIVVSNSGDIQIPLSRAKLEDLAKDKTSGNRAYILLALEILRLREKCGKPH